jgi:hypothetical protein
MLAAAEIIQTTCLSVGQKARCASGLFFIASADPVNCFTDQALRLQSSLAVLAVVEQAWMRSAESGGRLQRVISLRPVQDHIHK